MISVILIMNLLKLMYDYEEISRKHCGIVQVIYYFISHVGSYMGMTLLALCWMFSWPWSCNIWIYLYLWNQLLSLMLHVVISIPTSELDTTLMLVTCGRSVVFSWYSGFLHQSKWHTVKPCYNAPRFFCHISYHHQFCVSPFLISPLIL